MNNFIRYFNQNRKKIIILVLAVVLALAIINALNAYYKNQASTESQIKDKSQASSVEKIIEEAKEKNVAASTLNTPEKVLREFVNACNEHNSAQAYSLLTQDVKQYLYPTEQDFVNNYINTKFATKRTYSYIPNEQIKGNTTYIVKFTQDMLSTGKVDAGEEEFFTFIQEFNGTYKLNINDFFGSQIIGKTKVQDNINITVSKKNVFFNYETYNVVIRNNSASTICLDGKKTATGVYTTDTKGKKSFLSDLGLARTIIVKPQQSIDVELKFMKTLSKSNGNSEKITFEDVIYDYENFIVNSNNYTNRKPFEIEL